MEERANVLEVVSERLSKHVLANYDVFMRGIDEAASVENDLQVLLPQPFFGASQARLIQCNQIKGCVHLKYLLKQELHSCGRLIMEPK